MRGGKVLHRLMGNTDSSNEHLMNESSSLSGGGPCTQQQHDLSHLSAFDRALLRADDKRNNRARLPELMPRRGGGAEGGGGKLEDAAPFALSKKGAAIVDRLRRTFGDSIFTPQLDGTVAELEEASRRRIERSLVANAKHKQQQQGGGGGLFGHMGGSSQLKNSPLFGTEDVLVTLARGATLAEDPRDHDLHERQRQQMDDIDRALQKKQRRLARLLDLDNEGSPSHAQQTPQRHYCPPQALTPMTMRRGTSVSFTMSPTAQQVSLAQQRRQAATTVEKQSPLSPLMSYGAMALSMKSGKPTLYSSPERRPIVALRRGPPDRIRRREPTAQEVRRAQEEAFERRHQLDKATILEDKLNKLTQLLQMEEDRKLQLAMAQTAQRTAATVVSEWKDYVASHPETEDDREVSMRARAERRYNRSTNLTQAQYEKLIELSDSLGKTKRWRVPKNARAEVFKEPRLGCFPLKELPGETVVTEHEIKTVKGTTWIFTEEGWIATQLSFDGGHIQVQLVPEAEKCDATVREFMLETLDRVEDNIAVAMDACPLERMKGELEVKEFATAQLVKRQEIRDLPTGHHSFIKQTWRTMQEASRFQNLLSSSSHGADDDSGGDDDAAGAVVGTEMEGNGPA